MLTVYFTFILLIAFKPEWLGRVLFEGSVITLGIPVGISIILFAFLITGLYVRKANSEFDPLRKQIIEEIMRDAAQ
ncbi:Inner membrane protein YjcH [compost metagenome]